MSLHMLEHKPRLYAHFPDAPYRYCQLYNRDGTYGFAAIAEHSDAIELHLEMVRWGPKVCRSLRRDAAWLRRQAARRGKKRIVGIRQETGELDPRWPKFTRMFGFTGQAVMQTAYCPVPPTS